MKIVRAMMEVKRIEENQRKRNIERVFKHQGIFLHPNKNQSKVIFNTLTEKQLYIKLSKKWTTRAENIAATIIQKNVKRMIIQAKYRHLQKIRNNAALKIQRVYKEFRRFAILPRMIKTRKLKAVGMLQKFCKGYIVYKKFGNHIKKNII